MTEVISPNCFALKLAAVFLLVLASSAEVVWAQTPTPTPKSAEVIRLEEEKAQAELRQAIAEANKALHQGGQGEEPAEQER